MSKSDLREIFEMHYATVFGLVYGLTDDKKVSQDIVSETFILLWKMRDCVEGDKNIKAFLTTTARTMAITELKNKIHHV
jgi:DNA-directed RNA polymerase specialized sigma24 family protein